MAARNEAVVLELLQIVNQQRISIKAHAMLLENYAKRIDDLESKYRDFVKSVYKENDNG